MTNAKEAALKPTTPAPESPRSDAAATLVPGTIGFDVYLALFAPSSALTAPRVPRDLGKLVDYRA